MSSLNIDESAALAYLVTGGFGLAALAALVVLMVLHTASQGRSSPLAALMFVIFGPLPAALFGVGYLVIVVGNSELHRTKLENGDLTHFVVRFVSFGLIVAAIVTATTALSKTHEWFAHWEIYPQRPRHKRGGALPHVAADLKTLGLSDGATSDDVQRAYLELARVHHPDKQGDPEEFKRIHAAYCRAHAWIQVMERREATVGAR